MDSKTFHERLVNLGVPLEWDPMNDPLSDLPDPARDALFLARLKVVLGSTVPAILFTSMPEDLDDVVLVLAEIGKRASEHMRRAEADKEKADALRHDVEAIRRVLRTDRDPVGFGR